jgi:hypothetical protein
MGNHRFSLYLVIFAVLAIGLTGCGEKATQVIPVDPGLRETEVYLTVIAQFTQTSAAASPTLPPPPTPTPEPPTPTLTEIPPTPTVEPPAPTDTPVEATATTPSTSTPPPFASGTRIWWDDFEGERMWYTGAKEDSYAFEFLNGAYRIYNNLLGSIVWSIRGENYTDIRLEVDALKQKGPKDGYFGLICRYVDAKNYYALGIDGDATYSVVKMENSKINFLQQGDLPDKVLNEKDEYNRIRLDCIGASLMLYVNDKKVAEMQDASFATGDVGIGVGNQLEDSGIDVLYDNFEIWSP